MPKGSKLKNHAVKKIGILGGSFNPAHKGHLKISLYALKKLKLDEIWWVVSLQNPLKQKSDLEEFSARLASAKKIIGKRHKKMKILTIERKTKSRFTIDTLKFLKESFPKYLFILLIGADNWLIFHLWHKWKKLAGFLPIAIFRRRGYMKKLPFAKSSVCLAKYKTSLKSAHEFALKKPPAWLVLDNSLFNFSSTKIRQKSKLTKKGKYRGKKG